MKPSSTRFAVVGLALLALAPAARSQAISPGSQTIVFSAAAPPAQPNVTATYDPSTLTLGSLLPTVPLLYQSQSITLTLTTAKPEPIYLTLNLVPQAQDLSTSMQITVNGAELANYAAHGKPGDIQLYNVSWTIQPSMLTQTANGKSTIKLRVPNDAQEPFSVHSATLSLSPPPMKPNPALAQPPSLPANQGPRDCNRDCKPNYMFAMFGEITGISGVHNAKGDAITEIWTRSYALPADQSNPTVAAGRKQILPGPTYRFHPGDLLSIHLGNLMNPENDPVLKKYEALAAADASIDKDDFLEGHVSHEVNVPHNPDNTNLHVHGLHVDPRRDDVVIVITPQGASTQDYVVDTSKEATSDQAIKAGGWNYNYRIPSFHLPGTHWYHPHKHGSTAAHLEQGLAGALIMTPTDDNDSIAPGLGENDRVMILQELYNYGIQQGVAGSLDALEDDDTGAVQGQKNAEANESPDVTVNGQNRPTLTIDKNQTQRWRIINAGANHRNFGYFWLAKKTKVEPISPALPHGRVTYESVDMKLVATDGITRPKGRVVNADNPVLMGPGNRVDVMVQLKEPGDYALFKNFPQPCDKNLGCQGQKNAPKDGKPQDGSGGVQTSPATAMNPAVYMDVKLLIAGASVDEVDGGLIQNPFGLQPSGEPTSWANGPMKLKDDNPPTKWNPLVPILRATANNGLIDIDGPLGGANKDKAVALQATQPNAAGYQQRWAATGKGGGAVDSQILVHITVTDTPAKSPATMPTDAILAKHSPGGCPGCMNEKTPSYVFDIPDASVVQSRVAVFDISNAQVNYWVNQHEKKNNPDAPTQQINQFTLNGRVFALNDSVGGPNAISLVSEPVTEGQNVSIDKKVGVLEYVNADGFFTNVPQYSKVKRADPNDPSKGWEYNTPAGAKPTYADVTGLTSVAVVNHGASSLPDNVPGMPIAGTAEEWLLINNSRVGHPFHIHINPFFITEIGQLTYANDKWSLKTLKETDTMGYVLNTWWDTIIIPPHGYVKLRQWINVPLQAADNSGVLDNTNSPAIWVYHCHILRHEDRGMMMVMQSQQSRPFDIDGVWVDQDNHTETTRSKTDSVTGVKSLQFDPRPGVWWSTGTGAFDARQPYSGVQHLSNATGQTQSLGFCISEDADNPEIVFGNGIMWARSKPSITKAGTPINLSGTWTWRGLDSDKKPTTLSAKVTDDNGALSVVPNQLTGSGWWSMSSAGLGTGGHADKGPDPFVGKWNRGLGDAFKAPNPYSGQLTLTQVEIIQDTKDKGSPVEGSLELLNLCVTNDGNTIVFSNGMKWTRR